MTIDGLLSVTEAAKRLGGISKWTVHTWLSQGKYCRWTRSGTHCVSSQDENPNWVVGFRPPRWMTRRCTPSNAA